MTTQPLRVLQVNTYDHGGGAERVVWNLLQIHRGWGHQVRLAVGEKRSADPDVLPMSSLVRRGAWTRFWRAAHTRNQGPAWLGAKARALAEPGRAMDAYLGREDFAFPHTWRLLDLPPWRAQIVHCHNLHGGYFDLRALPWLSEQAPLLLTLHDAWLLSGHCAHSLGCERWTSGCGRCPDLSIEPAISRDATAFNWRRKRDIYRRSRLHLATPSRWLMAKVERSMLADGVAEARVIPNGVDLAIYRPGSQRAARAALDIPQEAHVLLFAANAVRRNIWKDYQTLRAALALLGARPTGRPLLMIALGEAAPAERVGAAELRFVPYQEDQVRMARFYQAADLYVHAARADTFPNTVLEALACGTPVVATAVGGIPEQIDEGRTGLLAPPGDAQLLAGSIEILLADRPRRRLMGSQAAEAARQRFDLRRQAASYLEWYQELAARRPQPLVPVGATL